MKKYYILLQFIVLLFFRQLINAQSGVEIAPVSATADQTQPSYPIEQSFTHTGTSTFYHSPWGDRTTLPVTLTYYFVGADNLNGIEYSPRNNSQHGNAGNFGLVDIFWSNVDNPEDSDFEFVKTIDFQGGANVTYVAFNDELNDVRAIRFNVKTANLKPDGNAAVNVGEMRFFGMINNRILPISAEADQFQESSEIEMSFEGTGNIAHYHSPWGTGTTMPVLLTYYFEDVSNMNSFFYLPRNNDYSTWSAWGNFREVNVYYSTVPEPGDNDFTLVCEKNFNGTEVGTNVSFVNETFPEGLQHPTAIRFEVVSANLKTTYVDGKPVDPHAAPAVSCGEMRFRGTINGTSTMENPIKDKEKVIIYPNPVQSNMFVEEDNMLIKRIVIYNLSGVIVKQLNSLQVHTVNINVKDLAAGKYLIKVITESDTIVDTFIKR